MKMRRFDQSLGGPKGGVESPKGGETPQSLLQSNLVKRSGTQKRWKWSEVMGNMQEVPKEGHCRRENDVDSSARFLARL